MKPTPNKHVVNSHPPVFGLTPTCDGAGVAEGKRRRRGNTRLQGYLPTPPHFHCRLLSRQEEGVTRGRPGDPPTHGKRSRRCRSSPRYRCESSDSDRTGGTWGVYPTRGYDITARSVKMGSKSQYRNGRSRDSVPTQRRW